MCLQLIQKQSVLPSKPQKCVSTVYADNESDCYFHSLSKSVMSDMTKLPQSHIRPFTTAYKE